MLAGLADPATIGMMLVGCIGGIIIGAIPGLSGSTGIILLLPLIYKLDMVPALVVMAGMFCGTMYGGLSACDPDPGARNSVRRCHNPERLPAGAGGKGG